MARLQGQNALVTGGTGPKAARHFLAEGATMAITGRNAQALAQQLARQSPHGGVGNL